MSAYADAIDAFRRDLLTRTLREHGANRAHAARALGITREYMQLLIRRHAIDLPGKVGRPAR
jgi:transcriptional regulator with GAF, ATPase, and Fis domain